MSNQSSQITLFVREFIESLQNMCFINFLLNIIANIASVEILALKILCLKLKLENHFFPNYFIMIPEKIRWSI